MRITKNSLREMVTELNLALGRPPGLMDIGHLTVDHNHIGYQLEEEINGHGAVFVHTGRMTAREMGYYLIGMIKGVSILKTQNQKVS